jgi:hypothetical protein
MKFEIYKTSTGYRFHPDYPPCEGAFMGEVMRVDTRNVDDPAKLTYYNALKDWYGRGTNHRVEGGHIKRDLGFDRVWMVEISTLEELMNLIARTDRQQIVMDGLDIEIYDDYRE